jgi:hypothetical protein
MTETDDVGAVLAKAGIEGDSLGVIDEGNEALLPIIIVTHENSEFTVPIQK